MLDRADALDGAHRARAEARARTVGHAKVHRHADQRHVERAERGLLRCIRLVLRAEEGSRAGERPLAAVALRELLVRDRAEHRVVALAAESVLVLPAQALESFAGDHRLITLTGPC